MLDVGTLNFNSVDTDQFIIDDLPSIIETEREAFIFD